MSGQCRLFMLRAVFAIVLACTSTFAHAQGSMAWLELGRHATTFDDGPSADGVAWGAGLQVVVDGDNTKDRGFVMPLGMELRGNWGASVDLSFTGDLGYRFGPVSFGPGVTFNFLNRSERFDPLCAAGRFGAESSCFPLGSEAAGTRDMGGFYGFAFSGFTKLSLGPQGRGFVQARYFAYRPSWITFLSSSEMHNVFNVFASTIGSNVYSVDIEEFHPVDFPEFNGGRDLRISAGWVFGGAAGSPWVLRAQLGLKKFDFTNTGSNQLGLFNQSSKQLSVGIGFRM